MAEKSEKGNRQPTLLLSLPQPLFDEVQGVATANKVGAQELFRRAAVALVRCHHTLGEVPLDMQLIQRRIVAPPADFDRFLDLLVKTKKLDPAVAKSLAKTTDPKWEMNESFPLAPATNEAERAALKTKPLRGESIPARRR